MLQQASFNHKQLYLWKLEELANKIIHAWIIWKKRRRSAQLKFWRQWTATPCLNKDPVHPVSECISYPTYGDMQVNPTQVNFRAKNTGIFRWNTGILLLYPEISLVKNTGITTVGRWFRFGRNPQKNTVLKNQENSGLFFGIYTRFCNKVENKNTTYNSRKYPEIMTVVDADRIRVLCWNCIRINSKQKLSLRCE